MTAGRTTNQPANATVSHDHHLERGRDWRPQVASIHFEQKRLYVVERFGKVDAWIDGVRVGSYADLREAKEAILKIRRPKPSPPAYSQG